MPGGEEPSVQQASTLSKGQERVADLISELIETGLEEGISWPDYGVPEIPGEQRTAYDRLIAEQDKWQTEIDQTLTSMIAGEPAFEFPFDEAAQFHQDFVATPAIETFSRNVQPINIRAATGFINHHMVFISKRTRVWRNRMCCPACSVVCGNSNSLSTRVSYIILIKISVYSYYRSRVT